MAMFANSVALVSEPAPVVLAVLAISPLRDTMDSQTQADNSVCIFTVAPKTCAPPAQESLSAYAGAPGGPFPLRDAAEEYT